MSRVMYLLYDGAETGLRVEAKRGRGRTCGTEIYVPCVVFLRPSTIYEL